MPNAIISDTICLIILTKIKELDLLQKVYNQIITTSVVAEEYGETLPDWIKIISVKDEIKQRLLELQIDKGESSAIALAMEIVDSTLILDDFKAHKIAEQLGLNYTGTLGVIVKAKLKGIIPSIKPLISKIKRTDFRISEDLELLCLKEAME